MISLDDYGGSGGSDVDLSPIYLSLGVLKSNTQSIWEFVSTMSNTTISYSTPYLETYRSEDEMYMYNITGDLTDINYAGDKFVRGYIGYLSNKSLYATNLDIEYIDSMSKCTFNGGTWRNAVSLRGGWFDYNSFDGNGKVSLTANVLAHNTFSSIKSLSIHALALHTILSDNQNPFVDITYLNIDCDVIKTPVIIASELSVKCREMSNGMIGFGIYENLNAMSMSNVILSQIENLNMTGQSMVSCAINALDFGNLQYNVMASNQILTVSDLNISCRLCSDLLLKSIDNLDFNVHSLYSLYISHDDMVKLNFYSADSISIECPNAPCDISLNGKSLGYMTMSNPSVLMHGSVKTLDHVQFTEGSVNLTCDLLDMCTLSKMKGIISAKTASLCEYTSCHDLTIYADVFDGQVKRCWDINFICDTLQNASFDSVSTMFLSFDHFTGKPYINAAYNMTFYKDLQGLTGYPSSNRPLSLLQGQNWLGTLWLKSDISEARGNLNALSLVGITITQNYDFTHCPVILDYISQLS